MENHRKLLFIALKMYSVKINIKPTIEYSKLCGTNNNDFIFSKLN